MKKIVTILGARPQFIKAAAVSHHFKTHFQELLVHTGQHYDANMSDVFFEELSIPKPAYHLGIGGGSHGSMTGAMLASIEEVLLKEQPDFVMVYGDTNSTFAGAFAASKLLIPVIHIEAGLRSFNRAMPEEQNRILTDHISDLLFAPTQTAVENLTNEGIRKGVHLTGDVMYDGILHFKDMAAKQSRVLEKMGIQPNEFHLCTIHRAENTNDPQRLKNIINGLNASGERIVLPLHPRTQKYLNDYGITLSDNISVTEPVSYLDMVNLESSCSKIITDSGGVQKEAFFLGKPCITLRDETEWVETVQNGWNKIVGASTETIIHTIQHFQPTAERIDYFGDGNAIAKIIKGIQEFEK